MKLAIIGTRDFNIYSQFIAKIKYHYPDVFTDKVTELVSGGGEGIDRLVEYLALKINKPIKVFFPDYIKYGREAPQIRNQEMADYADECILIMNDYPFIDFEKRDAVKRFERSDKSVYSIFLTDESFCIDWYKAKSSELPKYAEESRRRGDDDRSFPHPPLRYRLIVSGVQIEGGYFHYREDAEKVGEIIKKHYNYYISAAEIVIEENDSYE